MTATTIVRTPHRLGKRGGRKLVAESQEQKKARRAAQRWCKGLPVERHRRVIQGVLDKDRDTPIGIVIMLLNNYKLTGAARTHIDGLVDEIDNM